VDPPLENLKKTDEGYYISNEDIIKLANYIQDLQEKNQKLQALVDVLKKSLEEERVKAQELLAGKDQIIELQEQQIADYKELYESKAPSIFEKAGWVAGGTGIAAVIILLSSIIQ